MGLLDIEIEMAFHVLWEGLPHAAPELRLSIYIVKEKGLEMEKNKRKWYI